MGGTLPLADRTQQGGEAVGVDRQIRGAREGQRGDAAVEDDAEDDNGDERCVHRDGGGPRAQAEEVRVRDVGGEEDDLGTRDTCRRQPPAPPGQLDRERVARPGDPFTVELPGWGGGLPAARVTGAEIVFLAAYVAYAHLFGLRPRASAVAMYAALVAVVVLGVVFDRRVPALTLTSAAYLAVNADRLAALLRSVREG